MNEHLQDIMDTIIDLIQKVTKKFPQDMIESYYPTCYDYIHHVYKVLSAIGPETITVFKNTPSHFQIELIAKEISCKFPKFEDKHDHHHRGFDINNVDTSVIYNTVKHKLMEFFKDIQGDNPYVEDPTLVERVEKLTADMEEVKSTIDSITLADAEDEITSFDEELD